MAIAETVKNFLEGKSIKFGVVIHPHSGSSHETAEAARINEDHIAKAVIVKDDNGYAMILVPANHYVEMKHVRQQLGRELELVDEDEFSKLFPDCEPGAVPPLGPAYEIETFVDEALAGIDHVYLESGDHEHLVNISGDDFRALLTGVSRGDFSQND